MSEAWIAKGLCRLCHRSEGPHRSLEASYTHDGKEEMYSVILHDTFGIVLAPVVSNPSVACICGACEARLQDAALFKKQVLDCEERFNHIYLQDGCFKNEVKEETDSHPEGLFEDNLNITLEDDKYDAAKYLEILPTSIPKKVTDRNSSGSGEWMADAAQDFSDDDEVLQALADLKKYSCNICNDQFASNTLLQTHLKTHIEHTETHIGAKPCLICSESFNTNTDLIKHYGLNHGDGNNYPCNICSKIFEKPLLLKNHMKTHFSKKFKCTECEKGFDKKKDLKDHVRKIHSDEDFETEAKTKKFKCNVCKKQYLNETTLEKHMKIHIHKKLNTCLLCSENFPTNSELIKHYGAKHGDGTKYPCTICVKVFNEPILLKNHLKKHVAKKFKCTECDKEFQTKFALKEHIELHTGTKKYQCDICHKVFLNKPTFKSHMNTHNGEKSSICDSCGKRFLLKADLKRHIILVHKNVKAFSCDICKKNFSAKSYLATHQRQHTGEKPYSCEVCKKTFAAYTTLKVHLRIHSGYKPYACSYCDRQFAHVGSYRVHVRTHTGDKPFSCQICRKSFSDNGYLRIHLRLHSGEKLFSCEICNRSFSEKSGLKKHMRTHTGIKPHTCKICNKQISDLPKHMRRVHNSERPCCNICNKQFRKNDDLKTHMRIHTGDTE